MLYTPVNSLQLRLNWLSWQRFIFHLKAKVFLVYRLRESCLLFTAAVKFRMWATETAMCRSVNSLIDGTLFSLHIFYFACFRNSAYTTALIHFGPDTSSLLPLSQAANRLRIISVLESSTPTIPNPDLQCCTFTETYVFLWHCNLFANKEEGV